MAQQIVLIGGGTTFDTHKDYLSYLKNKKISLERLRPSQDWKNTLAEQLGDDFEVFVPRMPNKTNAQYKEWEIWFGRIIPLLGENIILIGHSLGGIFLAKYLSENKVSKAIKATILVAAPFDEENSEDSLASFKLPSSLSGFIKQSENIHLIHSKDDPVVPFSQLKKYQQALPKAKTMIFDNREHFKQETFPEIINLIKTLK